MHPNAGAATVLATAIYITGSTALESGHRYIISVHGAHLLILGPVEVDPSKVALDLEIEGVDATATDGRIVVSQAGRRSATVLAFMSIAGTTADGLAGAILEAARSAARA